VSRIVSGRTDQNRLPCNPLKKGVEDEIFQTVRARLCIASLRYQAADRLPALWREPSHAAPAAARLNPASANSEPDFRGEDIGRLLPAIPV
jgi:hypothetical protein